jgi:biotin-(acetyl-CoA carboxylase) ligase
MFEDNLGFKNQTLYFEKNDGTQIEGKILGVNAQGELQLEVNGVVQSFANQEIRFLLPLT